MVAMYSINGQALDDAQGRWVLTDSSELSTWGAPNRASVEVPGRMGALPVAPEGLGVATVTLGLTVFSYPSATTRCHGSQADLDRHLRALVVQVLRPYEIVTLTYNWGGEPRTTRARLTNAITPKFEPRAGVATLTAVYEVLDGAWHGSEWVMPSPSLALLDGGVLPVMDAVVELAPAPGSSLVTVRDTVSGSSMTWTGTAAAGQSVLVDVARYSAALGVRTGLPATEEALLALVPAGTPERRARALTLAWPKSVFTTVKDVSAGLSMSSGGFRLTPDAAGHYAVGVVGGTATVIARAAY